MGVVTINIAAMRTVTFRRCVVLSAVAGVLLGSATVCSAQIVETVGTRAMGMGGAFVAVASDSSATWWNPAGLATGPFSDVGVARAVTDPKEDLPAGRDRASWFAATVPAVGFSYYRLRITDIRPSGPTAEPGANREDTRAGVSLRSFSATELGLTVVQSVLPGVHAGVTLKYVRGRLRSSAASEAGTASVSELLDRGEALGGGDADSRFDLNAGLLGVAGPIRVGVVMRNVRAPTFAGGGFTLPRQTRVGAALDLENAGGPPLVFALDGDARRYATTSGDRRVVAAGAEQWLWARRIGIRGGGRFNTVGAKERVATAGASIAVRAGLYLEGQLVRGRASAERGWGAGARVTF